MTQTTDDSTDTPERICVGAVAGAFGVRGEVRVKSFCAEPKAIGSYDPLTDETGAKRFELTLMRPVKGGFAARMSGVVPEYFMKLQSSSSTTLSAAEWR